MIDPTAKENIQKFVGDQATDKETVLNHTKLFLKKFENFFKIVEKECPTSEEINRLIKKRP